MSWIGIEAYGLVSTKTSSLRLLYLSTECKFTLSYVVSMGGYKVSKGTMMCSLVV